MNREIKFRCWHKELKKMLHWDEETMPSPLAVDSNGYYVKVPYVLEGTIVGSNSVPAMMTWNGELYIDGGWQDVEWMQYTGFKDKNGKEIFEGDITEIIALDNQINRHIVKYGTARREMGNGFTVDIPCFYFEFINRDRGFKSFPIVHADRHDLQSLSIIGNCFETPELLNEQV